MNKIQNWFDKNGFNALRLSVAIGIAFAISTLIIFLVSDAPGAALGALLTGPLGSKRHFFNVLEMATPLAFTGFALSLIYQSGNFSMIADGSLYLGAVVASVIAIKLPLPAGIHPVVAIAVAAVVGGLVGAIPALLKVKYKSNELVTSL
ncbi:MAG: ABC transporter permease, partial [Niameybacter sp.]